MKTLSKSRWVVSELVDLKSAADRAGVDFREAKRRSFNAKFQYYWHREVLKLKPIQQVFYVPPPEKAAQIRSEAVGRVRHWDNERQAAHLALDAAKLILDKAVWQYREAKSRTTKEA